MSYLFESALIAFVRRIACAVALMSSSSAEGEARSAQFQRAPSASLIDVTPRGSLLIVDAYPGAVEPHERIICRYADDETEDVGVSHEDGSFRLELTNDRAMPGFGLATVAVNGDTSVFFSPLLWPPLMAAQGRPPRNDGWVCVTSADVDVTAEFSIWVVKNRRLQSWLGEIGKSLDEVRSERVSYPDSVSQLAVPSDPTEVMMGLTEAVDFKLYGFSPYGQHITCILPLSGRSFTTPIAEDGSFVIVLPEELVDMDPGGEKPVFLAIVTDRNNQQLSITGFKPIMPQWIGERLGGRINKMLQSLIDSPVGDMSFDEIGGTGEFSFDAQLGQIVLVNVWATWCGPCIREMPALEAIYPELNERGVSLLSLSVDEEPERVTAFMNKNGVFPFPVHSDSERKFLDDYRLSLPTTAVIDQQGNFRYFHMGPLTEEGFRVALQAAM